MSFDELNIESSGGDHEQWFEEVAAYVVGALGNEEEQRLLEHTADCARCRSRIQWLQPAVDLLPASVDQRTPSTGLRDRIMAEVRADLGEAPEAAAVESAQPTPAATAAKIGMGARVREWFAESMIPRPAMGMAATMLVAVAIAGGYVLGNSGSDGSPDPVDAVAVSQSAAATVSVNGDSGTLNVQQLPRTGRNETYQIWVIRDGDPEPSTVFDYDGRPVSAAIDGSLAGAKQIVVTLEPAGGSQQPRGPQILSADIS